MRSRGLPKPHCRLVGGHNKVELHRPKREAAGFVESALAHATTDACTLGVWCDHEGRWQKREAIVAAAPRPILCRTRAAA